MIYRNMKIVEIFKTNVSTEKEARETEDFPFLGPV